MKKELSHFLPARRLASVNADSSSLADALTEMADFDFEAVFQAEYGRVSRIIRRVVQDPGRAEDLAVDVFWKLLKNPSAQGPRAGGWLYRTAVRMAIDELRKQARREKYERLATMLRVLPTPEQTYVQNERQRRVQMVLARLNRRQAELLLLRSDGWSYQELAEALDISPASVGTLLTRAQKAFREEYIKRHGQCD